MSESKTFRAAQFLLPVSGGSISRSTASEASFHSPDNFFSSLGGLQIYRCVCLISEVRKALLADGLNLLRLA